MSTKNPVDPVRFYWDENVVQSIDDELDLGEAVEGEEREIPIFFRNEGSYLIEEITFECPDKIEPSQYKNLTPLKIEKLVVTKKISRDADKNRISLNYRVVERVRKRIV